MVHRKLSLERLAPRYVLDGGALPLVAPADTDPGDHTLDRYIVTLRADVDVHEFAGQLEQQGADVYQTYDAGFRGLAYRGPALADDPRVLAIEPDRVVQSLGQLVPTGVDRIGAGPAPTGQPAGSMEDLDIDIAIIDTGVDLDHPDLNVAAHRSTDCATAAVRRGGKCSDGVGNDLNGHGTHVAGIAAARDDQQGVVGVAPGARIWPVRVLDERGSGYLSWVIAGVNWVTQHADEIEIANMSLSFAGQSPALRAAIQHSVAAGVLYTVAAGNNSQDVFGGDGVYGTRDDIGPASYPEVAAVSALSDTDGRPGGLGPLSSYGAADRNQDRVADGTDDSVAWFSNFSRRVATGNPVNSPGNAIDLLLPGVDILSTWHQGGYRTMSGTSMAAPHAAGLAARYMVQHGRATSAEQVYEVRQALIDRAVAQNASNGLAVANDPDANPEPVGWMTPGTPVDSKVHYFSLQHGAWIDSQWFANEDIVRYDGRQATLLFDGSDVGIEHLAIDALAKLNDRDLLLSFSQPGRIGDLEVDDSDIVLFRASRLGSQTAGTFQLLFQGSLVGLTHDSEDIDGIEMLPDGRLLISTRGSFSVPGLRGNDEDVLIFTPDETGNYGHGRWSLFFNGSEIGLGDRGSEDIDAIAWESGALHFSTAGLFFAGGVLGNGHDVFSVRPASFGHATRIASSATAELEGATLGVALDNIWSYDTEMTRRGSASSVATHLFRPPTAPIIQPPGKPASQPRFPVLQQQAFVERSDATEKQEAAASFPLDAEVPRPAVVDRLMADWSSRAIEWHDLRRRLFAGAGSASLEGHEDLLSDQV